MAFFAAYWTDLSVQKYALTDVRFQIAFRTLGIFSRPITKWTLCTQKLNGAFAFAKNALFCAQPDLIWSW